MADISISKAHTLGLDGVQPILTKIVDDTKAEFPSLISDVKWNGAKTQADVKGKGFSAVFKVSESNMSIDVSLKFFAKPMKGKVQQKIEERVAKYFG